MPNSMLLNVKNFSLNLHRYSDLYLWKNLSFSLYPKNIISILGPNGSGKSALFRSILLDALYIPPHLKEAKKTETSPLIRYVPIAYLGTQFSIAFALPVFDVVMTGRIKNHGFFVKPSAVDIKICEFFIKKLQLEKFLEIPFNELSTGEKQRVLIARALVGQARIFLLDELDQHLDFYHQDLLMEILMDLKKESNLGLIIISHNPNWAKKLSDFFLISLPACLDSEKKASHVFLKASELDSSLLSAAFGSNFRRVYSNFSSKKTTPAAFLPEFSLSNLD